jgi:hypothetical protein
MGGEELTQAVGGSGGTPIRTNTDGTVETDNYAEGAAFDVTTYPTSIDPTETIQELIITQTGTEITADLTTKTGTVISGLSLRGVTVVLDKVEIDSITFNDPNSTGAPTYGMWVGE